MEIGLSLEKSKWHKIIVGWEHLYWSIQDFYYMAFAYKIYGKEKKNDWFFL